MLPHPQPLFLHLHHIVFLVLRVVDLLQLEEGNKQMLRCRRDAVHDAAVRLKSFFCRRNSWNFNPEDMMLPL